MTPYARLKRHYRAASETTRVDRGRIWYPVMREQLDNARGAHTLEQACAIFAITSQGAQLRSNLDWTTRALQGETRVGRFPNAQQPKIAAVLSDPSDAAEQCKGPKISAFYSAVAGDPDALVLDRWALFAALGEDYNNRDAGVTVAQRRAVEAAYRRLARELGEEVRALQAIVWLQVRETTPKNGSGTVPQLWDITL